MINIAMALLGLVLIALVAGWHIIWPKVKAVAASKGVGIFTGDAMVLFPTAEANPTKAIHMTLFGVEARDYFVGAMRSKTLVKQQVVPGKVKLVLPE